MSPLCKEQKVRKKLVREEQRFCEMSSGMQGGLERLIERQGPLRSSGFHTGLGIQFLAAVGSPRSKPGFLMKHNRLAGEVK